MLDTQLFIGKKPDRSKMEPVRNRPHWKPEGGLWTSTYRDGSSGWVEWCHAENFSGQPSHGWLLEPFSPRVLTLETATDLRSLLDTYGFQPGSDNGFFSLKDMIDWELLSWEWDGLHVTEELVWRERLNSMFLYGWDCESMVWFRWCFKGQPVKVKLDSLTTQQDVL